jgi:hypothetical protein
MATARQFDVTQTQLESAERGAPSAYADITCPGEHLATLVSVEDYDKGEGRSGWKWNITIQGAEFTVYTSFSEKARWKLIETVSAFDPMEQGLATVNPDSFVGQQVGAKVVWSVKDEDWDGESIRYREIDYLFPAELFASLAAGESDGLVASSENEELPF